MYRRVITHKKYNAKPTKISEPGIEWVQALADILHSALCCHSNETCAPIANPPNNAQPGGTTYHSPKLHPGLCSSVGMRQGTDRHTVGNDDYTFRLGYASHDTLQPNSTIQTQSVGTHRGCRSFQASSDFQPFGVDKWVVSWNWMSTASVAVVVTSGERSQRKVRHGVVCR